jgi:hypothetical protein
MSVPWPMRESESVKPRSKSVRSSAKANILSRERWAKLSRVLLASRTPSCFWRFPWESVRDMLWLWSTKSATVGFSVTVEVKVSTGSKSRRAIRQRATARRAKRNLLSRREIGGLVRR